MNLVIFGSRTLEGVEVRNIIEGYIKKEDPELIIISGGITGVCKEAINISMKLKKDIMILFLNFKYKKGAYAMRSKKALSLADKVLFIHDGKSKGTRNEIEMAKKMGIEYEYIKIENVKDKYGFDFSEGI